MMRFSFSLYLYPLVGLICGCSGGSNSSDTVTQSGGATSAGQATGGTQIGGQTSIGSGGLPLGSGGQAGSVMPGGGSPSGGGTLLGSGGEEVVAAGGSALSGAGGEANVGSGGEPNAGTGGQLHEGTGGMIGLEELAVGLHELVIHDKCIGSQQSQEDTCTHEQLIEETISFGGEPATRYLVTVRVRGLFEPTKISGGQVPDSDHPYFVVGGAVEAADYSQWQIEVMEPSNIYFLNHYPQTSHTIYQEDFEAQIVVSGGADIVVRVSDANDRQIDNATAGLPDRQQEIEGVTDGILNGQILRLDVVNVEAQFD